MIKNKLTTAVLVLLFAIILFTIGNVLNKRNWLLVKPGLEKVAGQSATPVSIPANNPPKEIKYDSLTDLKKELENVNPKVTDDDFQ